MPYRSLNSDQSAIGFLAMIFLIVVGLWAFVPPGYPTVLNDEKGLGVGWCKEVGVPKHQTTYTQCSRWP